MEVKGCTLERDGIGFFPDAPTERGTKHVRELMRAVSEGYQAILAFVIQMDGVREVRPNRETDPAFADAMDEAVSRGVAVWFLTCHVEPDTLTVTAMRKLTEPRI
jgi:sugar fermentation stimulation protein A